MNKKALNISSSVNMERLKYRTLRWRWIILTLLVTWLVGTIMVILYPVSALFWVLYAVGTGWQMGCLSERNEWHTKGNG